MTRTTQLLVVSKGHDYDHNAFRAMFDAMPDVNMTAVDQPAAQVLLQPDNVAPYDVVLFYDMSGIPGVGLLHDGANDTGHPPAAFVTAMEALVATGKGIMMINHATVGWPLWPFWRRLSGTSFMLSAGELNGQQVPGSGYRGGHGPLANATVRMLPQTSHPILDGLSDDFRLTDELYLKTAAYESAVTPLLRADYEFIDSNFSPPPLASAEEQANWSHPPGSDLLVWLNAVDRSPIFVSDVGDGPAAYENPDYRRLLNNAIIWLSSEPARRWAAEQSSKQSHQQASG